jgi:UDP-3-O-[3-hydroxymyristoyl] glucosamine N-acyltransferase
VVHPLAKVPASAHVGPNAVIEAGAVIGERTVVGALCYIGQDATVGDDCLLHPNVTVRERCRLGSRVIVHSGTTIGSDGFGYVPNLTGGLHAKIPQVGIVQIDDDVEIGANVAIDRARFGKTWIRRGVKIDNLVQIAHNVVVGELSFVVAQAGIAGSSKLGRGCVLWAQAGIAGHAEIGDGTQILAQSGVPKDLPPGSRVIGSPAVPEREFIRDLFNLHRIDKLAAQLKELKAQLAARQKGEGEK